MTLALRLLAVPLSLLAVVSMLPTAQASSTAEICIKNRLPFSFGGIATINLGNFGSLGINLSPDCSPMKPEQSNPPEVELGIPVQPALPSQNDAQPDNPAASDVPLAPDDGAEQEIPDPDAVPLEGNSMPTVE